jgi:ketosteroid isomerase-like protein
MKRLVLAAALITVGSVDARAQTPINTLAEAAASWVEAFVTGDAEAISHYFAEDVVAHYPGRELPVLGREANRQAWVRYYQVRSHHPLSTDSIVISAAGDLAYALGKYLSAAEDDPDATGGRYIAVWRRIEGEWKIALLMAHRHADVTGATFSREGLYLR